MGKGLEALIPQKKSVSEGSNVIEIKISEIVPNKYQPRQVFDSQKLSELTASIKEKGIVQPVLVRKKDGRYELIAGERRLRAAEAANLGKVPAIVKDLNDAESLEYSLIENIQREDLNPIEQANSLERLIEEFKLTQDDVAKRIGKERSTVTNLLRILGLDPEIKQFISRGEITVGHAKAILSLQSRDEQKLVAKRIVEKGLSVRGTENLVKDGRISLKKDKKKQKAITDPFMEALEEELVSLFGTRVNIKYKNDKGKIEIRYSSKEELDRIIDILGIKV